MKRMVDRIIKSQGLAKPCLVCGAETFRILTAPFPQDEGLEFILFGICDSCSVIPEVSLINVVTRELERVISEPFRRVLIVEPDGTITNSLSLRGRVLLTEN